MDRESVLLTGGTGFIGQNLTAALSAGHDCINVGRSVNSACDNVHWDLASDFPGNQLSHRRIGCLVHCASIVGSAEHIPTEQYFNINIKATARLLDFAVRNGVRHFVYISSGAVYGEGDAIFTEADTCNPLNRYGLSKYISEMLCSSCGDRLKVTLLRPFFPYGAGQTGRLIPTLTERILNSSPVILNKDGRPVINPVHISDFVSIALQIITQEITGTFNVCGDDALSILDICRIISEKLNTDKPDYVYLDNRVLNLTGSSRKICDLLDYKMQIGFDEGITEFVSAYLGKAHA